MAPKVRLDRLLVERGLAESREKAQAVILAGEVEVEGRRADKPGMPVPPGAAVVVRSIRRVRVGRAGEKLEGALDAFGVPVAGRSALDIGASIGGFTECLLRRGALCVIALDVGKGQLHWSLRSDPRVIPLEGINARYLQVADLPATPSPLDLVVCDVSFISLTMILPAVARVLPEGDAVVLVKPQFEAGRGKVGPGGILKDPSVREQAVRGVISAAVRTGFRCLAACLSPLPGAEGNRELFLRLSRGQEPPGLSTGLEESLRAALSEAEAGAPEAS